MNTYIAYLFYESFGRGEALLKAGSFGGPPRKRKYAKGGRKRR